MAEGELRCNVQACRQLLEENALVTSCSHIFCYQHGQISISNENCLACGTKFKNKTDFLLTDLRPSDQNKSMMLSGLHPDQVLEIANRSISFYTYQLFNENRLKDEMLKRSREEIENLKSYCGTMKTKYKADIDKFQRIASGLKKEIEEKIGELEKQREQICQYSRLSKKLQLELTAYKRQIATLKSKETSLRTVEGNYNFTTPRFDFLPERNPTRESNQNNNLFDENYIPSKWPRARYSD